MAEPIQFHLLLNSSNLTYQSDIFVYTVHDVRTTDRPQTAIKWTKVKTLPKFAVRLTKYESMSYTHTLRQDRVTRQSCNVLRNHAEILPVSCREQ